MIGVASEIDVRETATVVTDCSVMHVRIISHAQVDRETDIMFRLSGPEATRAAGITTFASLEVCTAIC